jgi:replication factor C small subunit
MNHYKDLWCEKYRPQILEDIVLSEENKDLLKSISNDIPHLLFWGKAGTGKTTTAKVIIKDILKCQYLYINASEESGIDTIRNKVISFAQTKSIDGQKKVIFLDECDGMSPNAMRSLRNVMEEFSNSTRFILTANYYNKIIEPIRSRCIIFNLNPDLKGCVIRCIKILKSENIDYKESMSRLGDFVKERYPDIRRMVNDLQKFSVTGVLKILDFNIIQKFSDILVEKFIKQENIFDIRKYIIENESNFDSDYQSLYKNLFNSFYKKDFKESYKKAILLELCEYTYRDNFVADHEINFFNFILAVDSIKV